MSSDGVVGEAIFTKSASLSECTSMLPAGKVGVAPFLGFVEVRRVPAGEEVRVCFRLYLDSSTVECVDEKKGSTSVDPWALCSVAYRRLRIRLLDVAL